MCPPPFVTRRLATHPLAAGFCYYAGGFSVTALSIAAGSTLFSPFTSVGSPIFNKEDIPAASIRRAQIFKTLVQDKPEASDAAYLDSLQQSHLSGLEQKLAMHPMIYSIPLVLAAAISPRFRKASKLGRFDLIAYTSADYVYSTHLQKTKVQINRSLDVLERMSDQEFLSEVAAVKAEKLQNGSS